MSTARTRSLAIVLGVTGIVCLCVALVERRITNANTPGVGIEGAYFNRSVGGAQTVFSYSGNWFAPFKPLNPYLWLGAASAFLIVSAVLTWFAIRSQPEHVSPTA